jgi:uncharacterized membrane protein YjfL (UPF0719 family)
MNNYSLIKNVCLFVGFFIMTSSVMAETYDEDDEWEEVREVMVDLFVGAMIGMCEQNATCTYIIDTIALVTIWCSIALVIWALITFSAEDWEDAFSKRPSPKNCARGFKRFATVQLGRSMVK